jgi:hypothetical protein
MERLTIVREAPSDEGTFGSASFGQFTWHSLELPWHGNLPDISCIPAGLYTAIIYYSPRLQRSVYLLQNVLGRSDVEIHPANWAGDVMLGWHADLLGCITLGKGVGELTPPGGPAQLAVLSSVSAVMEFMSAAAGQPIEVAISWKDGASPEVA